MKKEFAGKHTLITGAASGIGRETAFAFAERGASLQLVDIDLQGLERTALLCRALGASARAHIVDVSSPHDMADLAARVHQEVPALDILVNNAGVGIAGSFVGTDLASIDWAFSVNVNGVVHGCHFFLPKMIERGTGGHVVNVASAAGLAASKQMAVYAATKFAVVGLSEALQMELAPAGIGVTTLCPGVINTPITRNSRLTGDLSDRPGYREAIADAYVRRNYGPERVAQAIVRAVRTRGGVRPVSPESWLLYYGKRFAPRLIGALLARDMV